MVKCQSPETAIPGPASDRMTAVAATCNGETERNPRRFVCARDQVAGGITLMFVRTRNASLRILPKVPTGGSATTPKRLTGYDANE